MGCPSPVLHVYKRNSECFILVSTDRRAEGYKCCCYAVVPAGGIRCALLGVWSGMPFSPAVCSGKKAPIQKKGPVSPSGVELPALRTSKS